MRLRRVLVVLALATVGMAAWAGSAGAQSFTVTTTNDSNDLSGCTASLCSLRDAVVAADAAGGSSTITVPAGTYKLTIPSAGTDDPATGDLDINPDASVTITGAGAASTIIDANHIDRVFAVHEGASLQVSGVTIEHGEQVNLGSSQSSIAPGDGGAIYNDGSLSISDAALSNNAAFNGSGVYSDSDATSTSVSGSNFAENGVAGTASNSGAIGAQSGSLTLTNDTFNANFSGDPVVSLSTSGASAVTLDGDTFTQNIGGALSANTAGPFTITGSSFSGNNAAAGMFAGPAAITAAGISSASITSTSVTNNVGELAAVELDGLSASTPESITDSTISANNTGEAAVADSNGELQVTNTTIDDNYVIDGGALTDMGPVGLTLTNDTIDSNRPVGVALGQAPTTGTTTLLNDTIAHNQTGIEDPEYANTIENTIVADSGVVGDCTGASGPGTPDSAGAADKGGNIDSDGSCFSDSVTGDQTGVDPLLGPLADNGGPTETDALLAGSPAIGHAIGADCPSSDQRGVPRSASSCDVGAFQTAPANLSLSDSAPSSVDTNQPFTYTVTASNGGPAPSTNTTVVDQLPAGATLWGANPSQGSCTSSGTPAKVTCDLGVVDSGSNGSVSLVVSVSAAGSVTDAATATNDQGSSASASATTMLIAPVVPTSPTKPTAAISPTKPTAVTGGAARLGENSVRLSGDVTTGGQPTYYFFQYGKTKKLGRVTFVLTAGSAEQVLRKLVHLQAGTRYHYRLAAVNESGKAYGDERTFRTR